MGVDRQSLGFEQVFLACDEVSVNNIKYASKLTLFTVQCVKLSLKMNTEELI
jgi:hypothetical protein